MTYSEIKGLKMMLNDNPSLEELRTALVAVANGAEVETSQINAIKSLISLKLNEERLKFSRIRLGERVDLQGFETI